MNKIGILIYFFRNYIYLLVETAEQAVSWLESVVILLVADFNDVIKSLLLFVLLLFRLLIMLFTFLAPVVDSSAEFEIDEETNDELEEVDDDDMLDCEFDWFVLNSLLLEGKMWLSFLVLFADFSWLLFLALLSLLFKECRRWSKDLLIGWLLSIWEGSCFKSFQ